MNKINFFISLGVIFLTFLLFLFFKIFPAFGAEQYFSGALPVGWAPCARTACPAEPSFGATCANGSSVGSTDTDCGLSGCSGGSTWSKYSAYSTNTCYTFGAFCFWAFQLAASACSIGDKCLAPPYSSYNPYSSLNAGLCGCTAGGIYKTCCNTSTGTPASQTCSTAVAQDSTTPPYEGTCPAGSVSQLCGFGSYPACGQPACDGYAPALPNLVTSSSWKIGTFYEGASVSFGATVQNQGGASAGSFATQFRVCPGSNNCTDTDSPTALGTPSVGSLSPTATSNLTSNTWSSIPRGTYSLRVWADINSSVSESNELDNGNWMVGSICVEGKPDLPTSYSPSTGATGVSTTPTLSWTFNSFNNTCAGAMGYRVDFGTTNPPPAGTSIIYTGQATGTHNPGTLLNGTTYYWSVVKCNDWSCRFGPVLSFTTVAGPTPTPAPFDYSLSNLGNVTVATGSNSVVNTITETLLSGTTQTVTLSVSGVPSGATSSLGGASCPPTCSRNLSVNTGTAAPGTYLITVTGSPLSKTTSFNLTITTGPTPTPTTGPTPTPTPAPPTPTSSTSIPPPATNATCPVGEVFGNPLSLGGAGNTAPVIENVGDQLIIAIQGADNAVYIRERTAGGTFVDPGGWYSIGGIILGRPKLAFDSGTLYLYVPGSDGFIYKNAYVSERNWGGFVYTGISNSNLGSTGPSAVSTPSVGTFRVSGTSPILENCVAAPTPTPAPSTISGNVFVDNGAGGGTANNGVKDGTEASYTASTLTITRTGGSTTTSTGNYSFTNLLSGTYDITLTVPPSYVISPGNSVSVSRTVPPNTTANFGIIVAPTYSISGNVFVDDGVGGGTPKDGIKNGTEGNYTSGTSTIQVRSGGCSGTLIGSSSPANGAYSVDSITAGTYSVCYTTLPSGYQMINPTTGPPPFFSVSVVSSNVPNVNFAIAPVGPWIQSTGADIRFDDGFNYYLPAPGGSCVPVNSYASVIGGGGIPGIIFTGDRNAIFGQGSASFKNWVVGGTSYPEVFTPAKGNVIRTSYNYINAQIKQAGLTPVDITAWCGITNNCVLGAGFPHGLYIANGDLTFSGPGTPKSYTFPTPPTGGNYVILVNGNLTINTQIHVPTTSTVTFIVSGDIIVASTVGNTTGDFTTTTPQIEGFYSTDGSFITGTGSLRLNIAGSIIVNAGLTGGTFQLQRDLVAGNANCPAFSIQERPDFILNAPDLIKYQNTIYQELAP